MSPQLHPRKAAARKAAGRTLSPQERIKSEVLSSIMSKGIPKGYNEQVWRRKISTAITNAFRRGLKERASVEAFVMRTIKGN